ncbi:hypothetical protein QYF36_009325 [Acer negundo]|nr:hypothetical protein QYF36_009325 [Acer negundo]
MEQEEFSSDFFNFFFTPVSIYCISIQNSYPVALEEAKPLFLHSSFYFHRFRNSCGIGGGKTSIFQWRLKRQNLCFFTSMADEQISDNQIGEDKRRTMGEVRRWIKSETDLPISQRLVGG